MQIRSARRYNSRPLGTPCTQLLREGALSCSLVMCLSTNRHQLQLVSLVQLAPPLLLLASCFRKWTILTLARMWSTKWESRYQLRFLWFRKVLSILSSTLSRLKVFKTHSTQTEPRAGPLLFSQLSRMLETVLSSIQWMRSCFFLLPLICLLFLQVLWLWTPSLVLYQP